MRRNQQNVNFDKTLRYPLSSISYTLWVIYCDLFALQTYILFCFVYFVRFCRQFSMENLEWKRKKRKSIRWDEISKMFEAQVVCSNCQCTLKSMAIEGYLNILSKIPQFYDEISTLQVKICSILKGDHSYK
jgi:hypothetical protein